MKLTTWTILTLTSLLILAACGGGSTDTGTALSPLNSFEEDLVGHYVLDDFKLYAEGDQIYTSAHFSVTAGEMVLNADRTGSLFVDLADCASGPDRDCERAFTWRADSGLLQLECAAGTDPNGIAEWEQHGGRYLDTRFFVPTNRPDCAQYLIDQGYEIFYWVTATP